MNYKQAAVIGIALGITAGLIVWFLERFETDRLHREVRGYLKNVDEFNEWLREKGGN